MHALPDFCGAEFGVQGVGSSGGAGGRGQLLFQLQTCMGRKLAVQNETGFAGAIGRVLPVHVTVPSASSAQASSVIEGCWPSGTSGTSFEPAGARVKSLGV